MHLLFLYLGLGVLLILLAAALWISRYAYEKCFYSPNEGRNNDPYGHMGGAQYRAVQPKITASVKFMDGTPFEWVKITSFDGLTLWGRYYHFRDGAPVNILFHGYRSMSLRDCAGGFALSAQVYFNVLAVDERAQGRSEGKTITFGIRERWDCLRWANYVTERFGAETPILLSGLSMGGTVVLMASELDLPRNVVGIFADCPFATPSHIIQKVCKEQGYPPKVLLPFIYLGALLFGHFWLDQTTAPKAVAHAKVPILIIHGQEDYFVPWEMSQEIKAHCVSPARLELFPKAGHGLSYLTDPERYERVCMEFFDRIPELRPFLQENPLVREHLGK